MTDKSNFDDSLIRKLATILTETDLSEIEYETDNCRVRVARQIQVVSNVLSQPVVAQTPTPLQPVENKPQAASAPTPHSFDTHPGAVKAPMVGSAYASATPGAEPFVKVGSKITKGQTLLIIEAMKVMNQIRASQDGTVTQILFKDGDPVEYDQPLMIIE